MSSVQVKGLSDLQKALDTLPAKLQANVMRGALRAAGKPIAEAARSAAPVAEGDLAASIRIATRVKSGTVIGRVVAGGKGSSKRGAAYHAHLVEYGTRPHIIEAKPPNKMLAIGFARVEHPGARPKPFMRPALDTAHGTALAAMAEYIRNRLKTKHGIDVPAPVEEGDE